MVGLESVEAGGVFVEGNDKEQFLVIQRSAEWNWVEEEVTN